MVEVFPTITSSKLLLLSSVFLKHYILGLLGISSLVHAFHDFLPSNH